jgi:hypothetical protein
MGKKVDSTAALAEQMIKTLEELRAESPAEYAPTLRRLGELCASIHTPDEAQKAAGKKAFTSKAVVTGKTDRKPSLDARVYFKQDVPPPQAQLSARMLLVLEAQRRLGNGAYPLSLGRLAELCERKGSDALVKKAVAHPPLSETAIVATKAGPEALVVLKADVQDRMPIVLPALLRHALRPSTSKVKGKLEETHAFALPEVSKRFIKELHDPIGAALRRALDREDLPQEVAWVRIKGEPYLFLRENLKPSGARIHQDVELAVTDPASLAVAPSAPPRQRQDFAQAFREAFERLDRRSGATNFIKLSDLRRALPEFGRDEFDAGLRALRVEGLFSLDSHEGLYGMLTADERDAGVAEAGSLLVYASRR